LRKLLQILIILISSNCLFAQSKGNLPPDGRVFIDSLITSGVDTVGYLNKYEEGVIKIRFMDEKLNTEKADELYVFWIKQGISYMRKYEYSEKSPISIEEYSVFWNYLFQSYEIIMNEGIKPAILKIEYDNLGYIIEHSTYSTCNNYEDIFVKVSKDSILFRFNEEYNFSKINNPVNYDYNANLICYSWKRMINSKLLEHE